jgi:phosphohistidine phosphatase SixA
MPTRRELLAVGAAIVGAPALALAEDRRPAPSKRTTPLVIYLVRHAEKAKGRDPVLTVTGVARAKELARVLQHVPVQAVYSTATKRTRQTAAPIAKAAGVEVRTYEARPEAKVVTTLRAAKEETVLVVGHSNTLSQLISAFGLDPGGELLQGYEDLFQIIVPAAGAPPLLQRLSYGASSS